MNLVNASILAAMRMSPKVMRVVFLYPSLGAPNVSPGTADSSAACSYMSYMNMFIYIYT